MRYSQFVVSFVGLPNSGKSSIIGLMSGQLLRTENYAITSDFKEIPNIDEEVILCEGAFFSEPPKSDTSKSLYLDLKREALAEGWHPDITFFLNITPQKAAERSSKRGIILSEPEIDQQGMMLSWYRKVAVYDPNILAVNADRTFLEVIADVLPAINSKRTKEKAKESSPIRSSRRQHRNSPHPP